ncbi:hypothetical protein DV532_26565 (plasmid) [Pseudomonas sp. Leaf58]|uniref:hypothetical protein n=1 Tax=Pseudomonas sp. Leaf58 TaxID=1736226 RepID=UPI0006F9E318|nr:hypothetical protein [Pseudomonas sp. Leaf58]AYG47850.1 hypothetical protein DV532_26565 [Pseudomonas sp. Leaf58]KQN62585.1 hypothetical protein ASF02_10590 [Pseudomonas sp. Leaf58]
MEPEISSFLHTVLIGCLCVGFISAVISPASETAGRFALTVVMAILAGIGYSIYLFGAMAVLKVVGYFAGLIISMLAIGFLVSVVRSRRSDRTFKFRQAGVVERFPSATRLEIHRICVALDRGKTLDDFKWDGERVILGEGENARIAGSRGWVSINAPTPDYVYLAQQKELDFRLQSLGVKLSIADHHALCALLYFNWEVLEMTVDGERHALLAMLGRRADTRYERYSLRMAESTA